MNRPKRLADSLQLPSGRTLTLTDTSGAEDTVEVRGEDGDVEVVLRFTAEGLQITASAARLSLKAAESITMSAPEIHLDALTALRLDGAASASVSSSGVTSVQGGLVRIN